MSEPRCIVVTGVSRGLGRALAGELAARGHVVVGCARCRPELETLAGQLPGPHRFDPVDVACWDEVDRWSRSVVDQGLVPDLLLNNAGLINRNAPLWQVPPDEFARVVAVNLTGVYHVLRGFLPAMIERRRGVVVNFSSGWGRSASPEVGPYCATKWAVEGLTRSLAAELPPSIAAVALNPGIIHTRMLESCFGASASGFPDPDQWVERAATLLLELDASHNGQALTAP